MDYEGKDLLGKEQVGYIYIVVPLFYPNFEIFYNHLIYSRFLAFIGSFLNFK